MALVSTTEQSIDIKLDKRRCFRRAETAIAEDSAPSEPPRVKCVFHKLKDCCSIFELDLSRSATMWGGTLEYEQFR